MLLLSQYTLGQEIRISPSVLFVFFATLFAYNALRLMALMKVQGGSGKLLLWVERNKLFLIVLTVFSFLLCSLYFFKLDLHSQIAFFIAGVLSLGYSIPVKKGHSKGLRKIPLVKTFVVGLTWGVATVFPDGLINMSGSWILFIARVLFIWGLTLPFDFRDMDYDREEGIMTIAGTLGIPKTKVLVYFLFAVSAVLHLYVADFHKIPEWTLSFLIPSAIVYFLKEDSDEYWYTFALDATILLQFLLLIIR